MRARWCEIGEGESGLDKFISTEALEQIAQQENVTEITDVVRAVEALGFVVENIEDDNGSVFVCKDDEDDDTIGDFDDDYTEVGFNPYLGCYDYDC